MRGFFPRKNAIILREFTMKRIDTRAYSIKKPLFISAAFGALSACATVSGPPTAGAPSSHAAKSYETLTSTAAVTSALEGSEIQLEYVGGIFSGRNVRPSTGSMTHDTGRLEIDDGTYLFVDADGADASGSIVSGTDVGSLYQLDKSASAHVYDYVTIVGLDSYGSGTNTYASYGVLGVVTNAADLPIAGSASYTGDAKISTRDFATGATISSISVGAADSTIDVDFAAGLVSVDISNFQKIYQNGRTATGAAAAIDHLKGTGMVISGAHFTGGSWVTFKNGVAVDLVGASATTTSDGTFFGYDSSISAPDEVGGVVLVQNGSTYLSGIYVGD